MKETMTEEQRKNVKNAIERAITHIAHKWNVRNDEVITIMKALLWKQYMKTTRH